MTNQAFLDKAEALKKPLKKWTVSPKYAVKPVRDPAAWQGWSMKRLAPAGEYLSRSFKPGAVIVLDFGEEFAGKFRFRFSVVGSHDAPVKLRFLFAETANEVGERRRKCVSWLSHAWFQEEVVVLDDAPAVCTLPRVYAMRYVCIEVLNVNQKIRFDEVKFTAQSAVRGFVPPLASFPEQDVLLDRAAQRTLRCCMQEVVLDGPKRDRRLWLGDLRLEAFANAVTYKEYGLFERCTYLLAAFSDERGMIPACMYHRPVNRAGSDFITDYAFLFSDLILFHFRQTGNAAFLRDLYPIAAKQFEIFRPYYAEGAHGVLLPGWNFIDWCEELDRETPVAETYVFGLKRLAECADALKRRKDAAAFRAEAEAMASDLRKHCFDKRKGLFTSGRKKQFSAASQIWGILAGIVTPEEARKILKQMETAKDVVQPVTPYLRQHLLMAYQAAGDQAGAERIMRHWWGMMLDKGMTVYPEVFVPSNERLSPYTDGDDDPRINSACHAWSCAPSCILRS